MRRFILSLILLLAGSGWAAVNEWGFNFQSELLDENGNVYLDDRGRPARRQTIQIRLYDVEKDGTPLWGRQYVVFCDVTGYFNVFVTDAQGTQLVNAKLESVFSRYVGGGLYVGVTRVGDDKEMLPRPRLCAVPNAAVANVARTLSPGATVEGRLSVGGTVTAMVATSGTMKVTGTLNLSSGGKLLRNGQELLSVPVGGIILWYNDKAPDGNEWLGTTSEDGHWQKVSGLFGKFPLGVGGNYKRGDAGGSEKVVLQKCHMPRHSHEMIVPEAYGVVFYSGWQAKGDDRYVGLNPEATYGFDYGSPWIPDSEENYCLLKFWDDSTFTQSSWRSDTKYGFGVEAHMSSYGGDQPHENMPPYRVVEYIRRIK